MIDEERLKRMRACICLLPEPGYEVARDLIDEIERLRAGWKEAAIAWEVCASVHEQWAKKKDALYSTRHGDFVKHAADARAKLTPNAIAQGREHSERPAGAEG